MPVLNKYKDVIPPDAVYIGRGSKWGNPFPITESTTREQSLEQYKPWLIEQVKQGKYSVEDLASLHGKPLVCFCSPKACHGHAVNLINTMQRMQETL